MSTAKLLYGSATTITITLNSLANSATAGRESTKIDNTTNLYVDALVQGFFTTGTSPTAGNTVEIWAYSSIDNSDFTADASGVNAAMTPLGSKGLLRLLRIIEVTGTSNVRYSLPAMSIAAAFDGVLPPYWGLWVINGSGAALNATAGNHVLKYMPIQYQSA